MSRAEETLPRAILERALDDLAAATASVRQLRADVELATAQRDKERCRADDAEAIIETRNAENVLLREKLAVVTARVEELEESASMACQSPADDCDCAGCLYAGERGGAS